MVGSLHEACYCMYFQLPNGDVFLLVRLIDWSHMLATIARHKASSMSLRSYFFVVPLHIPNVEVD